ncbi:diaminopimelate epimerase [uncultured Ruminococcus sp.]|uniref:diaminopimelate epimerase n=1 Tax=uncultured Ruminococcus sp. TaxID=165186 RepID=UPI00292EA5B3|nr:diaminopimelate epimerase [uncultured Ruminococcus sp.]
MKKLRFTKMHGISNDYVYISTFDQPEEDWEQLAIRLSDRRTGIGGDGIILVCPSEVADAKMRIFNADGSEGKMCGNGIRCVGKFVYDKGLVPADKTTVTIDTLSGIKTLELTVRDGKVQSARVDMGAAILNPAAIPVKYEGETMINVPLEVDGKTWNVTAVSMGNPHCVTFVDDVDSLELEKLGPHFENHPAFPERVNTEFVRVIDDHTLQMRVWERGSGETWACGTGACATAVAACLNGYCKKGDDITVHLRGGDLVIRYTDDTVIMTGPASTVFEGEVEIES